MQFKDPRKEFEIEFDHIGQSNGKHRAVFILKINSPVKVSDRFEASDINTERGTTGIRFSEYSAIAKAYKAKTSVLSGMPQEALDYIRSIDKEETEKLKEEAKKDPKTWRWHTGCDTGNLYLYPNTEMGFEYREDLREMSEVIEKVHKFHAHELFGKEEEKNLVSHEIVMKIYTDIIEQRGSKKAEAQQKKQKTEAPIFAKAKETGIPQILESFLVECTDPKEECDADQVIIYCMPDGTTKRTQNHTW